MSDTYRHNAEDAWERMTGSDDKSDKNRSQPSSKGQRFAKHSKNPRYNLRGRVEGMTLREHLELLD